MGRNRIAIKKISNERNRKATFAKRKSGLIKKAMELSILCDCQIALVIINSNDKIYNYSSSKEMKLILDKLNRCSLDSNSCLTNADYLQIFGNWKSSEKKRTINEIKQDMQNLEEQELYEKSSDSHLIEEKKFYTQCPNSLRRHHMLNRSCSSDLKRHEKEAPLSPEFIETKSTSSSSSSQQTGYKELVSNFSAPAVYQNKISKPFSPHAVVNNDNQASQYFGQYPQQYRVPSVLYQGVMMNLPCSSTIQPSYGNNAGIYSNSFCEHGYLNFSSMPIHQEESVVKDKVRDKSSLKNEFVSDKLNSYNNTVFASFQNLSALNSPIGSANGVFANIPSSSSAIQGRMNFFSDCYINQVKYSGPNVSSTDDSYGELLNKIETK